MALKKQAHGGDKVAAKQRPKSSQPEAQNSRHAAPHTHPAPVIQRAACNPCSLTRRDVLQLQSLFGNRATERLLTRTARSQPSSPAQNSTGLPDRLKAGVESLSGLSLDDVKVHYNSPEPARMQALAYTRGADIHVAPGQEAHLPHEAWHVVQQKQGRVRPTLQAKGSSINDDRGLEREADLMGVRALRAGGVRAATGSAAQTVTTVQRVETAAALRHTSAPMSNVAQLKTALNFSHNVTGNDVIVTAGHTRAPVHATAWKWVLDHGAWKSVEGGTVCNHSRDYRTMEWDILTEITNGTLQAGATAIKKIHTSLKGNNQGIDAPPATHADRMNSVITHPNLAVDPDEISDTFNYYIYKICDYPRNLFYWPDKTDGDPDEPLGEYDDANAPDDWEVRNTIISKKKRLSDEKKRLKDARADLTTAFK